MMSVRKEWMIGWVLAAGLLAGGCREGDGQHRYERSCDVAQGQGKPNPVAVPGEPAASQDAQPRKETEEQEKGWLSFHRLGMAGGFMLLMMALMFAAMG